MSLNQNWYLWLMIWCEMQKAGIDRHTSTCCRTEEETLTTRDKQNQAYQPDKYKYLLKKRTGCIIATMGISTLKLL